MKYFVLLACLFCINMNAQEKSDGHFLVEFEAFTPPIKDMIRSFEGQPAEQFMANDISGKEQFLGNYKGKKVILWFWSVEHETAIEQFAPMSLLQKRNKSLKIIGFAKEPKAKVQDFLRQYPTDLSIIPNGEIFGQMAYGADLGNPRMFLIDELGIIKAVLPSDAFVDNDKLLISLESILNGM